MVDLERRGQRRPPGAPPAGVSPGAEYVATAVWIALVPGRSTVELRLADASTGRLEGSARVTLSGDPTPVRVARSVVTAILEALDDLGRRPAWQDPLDVAGGMTGGEDIDETAVVDFMRGLAAEEVWSWEDARRGYQAASSEATFFEATAALARAARLRTGGTLGEN